MHFRTTTSERRVIQPKPDILSFYFSYGYFGSRVRFCL